MNEIKKYQKEFIKKINKIKDQQDLEKLGGTLFTFMDEFTRDWWICFKKEEEMNAFLEMVKENYPDIDPLILDIETLNPEIKYIFMVGQIDKLIFLDKEEGFNFQMIHYINKNFNGLLKDSINYADCYFIPEIFFDFYQDTLFWKNNGIIELFKDNPGYLIHNNIAWIETWNEPKLSLIEMNNFCLKEAEDLFNSKYNNQTNNN